jgi:hypothetical protein
VSRSQKKVDVMKRLGTQQRQCLRCNAEHVLPVKLLHLHMVFSKQPILSIVGSEIEERFVDEWSGWHRKDSGDEQIKKECKKTSRFRPPIDLSLRR